MTTYTKGASGNFTVVYLDEGYSKITMHNAEKVEIEGSFVALYEPNKTVPKLILPQERVLIIRQ